MLFDKPYRVAKAEKYIAGRSINATRAQAAGAADDTYAKAVTINKYRIQAAAGMVEIAILACA